MPLELRDLSKSQKSLLDLVMILLPKDIKWPVFFRNYPERTLLFFPISNLGLNTKNFCTLWGRLRLSNIQHVL